MYQKEYIKDVNIDSLSATSELQTLSHNVLSSTPHLSRVRAHELVVISTNCTGSCKSNYHTITTAPILMQ
jgi:hypothetical protein